MRCWPLGLTCAIGRRSSTLAAPKTRTLLLVWHSRTGLASQMANELERGALDAAALMDAHPNDFTVLRRRASAATVTDLLDSDGYIFCAPENLASVTGEMLEFFQRSYYHAFATIHGRDETVETSMLAGRPFAVAVAAGSDGTNAARQMQRICTGWRLRPVTANALIVVNGLPQTAEVITQPKELPLTAGEQCRELGGLVAATMLL